MTSSILFRFVNILVMLLLIVVISLQNKSSGLSNVFGGGGNIV
jgi:preprotein translocase subunit SecG